MVGSAQPHHHSLVRGGYSYHVASRMGFEPADDDQTADEGPVTHPRDLGSAGGLVVAGRTRVGPPGRRAALALPGHLQPVLVCRAPARAGAARCRDESRRPDAAFSRFGAGAGAGTGQVPGGATSRDSVTRVGRGGSGHCDRRPDTFCHIAGVCACRPPKFDVGTAWRRDHARRLVVYPGEPADPGVSSSCAGSGFSCSGRGFFSGSLDWIWSSRRRTPTVRGDSGFWAGAWRASRSS